MATVEQLQTEHASGIIEHRFADDVENLVSFIEKLPKDLKRHLLVNKKRYGETPIPGWGDGVSGD